MPIWPFAEFKLMIGLTRVEAAPPTILPLLANEKLVLALELLTVTNSFVFELSAITTLPALGPAPPAVACSATPVPLPLLISSGDVPLLFAAIVPFMTERLIEGLVMAVSLTSLWTKCEGAGLVKARLKEPSACRLVLGELLSVTVSADLSSKLTTPVPKKPPRALANKLSPEPPPVISIALPVLVESFVILPLVAVSEMLGLLISG